MKFMNRKFLNLSSRNYAELLSYMISLKCFDFGFLLVVFVIQNYYLNLIYIDFKFCFFEVILFKLLHLSHFWENHFLLFILENFKSFQFFQHQTMIF